MAEGDIGGRDLESYEQQAARLELQKELNLARIEANTILGNGAEVLKRMAAEEENLGKARASAAEAERAYMDAVKKGDDDASARHKRRLFELETEAQRLMELAELERKNVNDIKTFYTAITGVSETAETSLGRSVKAAGGFSGALEQLKKSSEEAAAELFTLENVQMSMADSAVQAGAAIAALQVAVALGMDQAAVDFSRTTGLTGQFRDEVMGLSNDMLTLGISAQQMGSSYTAMTSEFAAFTTLSEAQRAEITTSAALLDKMGFSVQQQAKNMAFLTNSIGLSATEAQGFNTSLASLSQELGMPIDQLTQGFDAAKTVLGASASSSAELTEQFGQLAAQAKATNIPIGELVGLAQKFDTFDGAAQSVGRLNAMLGGPFLSSLEMVQATNPAERIEMLSNALQDAGRSFDEMSYYERKAIADAAGLKDVNDLALLMSGNLDMIEGPEMDQQSIVEMREQMIAFNTITEKLQNSFMSLAIAAEPMLDAILFGVNLLTSFVDWMSQSAVGMGVLGAAAGVLGVTFMASIVAPLVTAAASLATITGITGIGLGAVALGLAAAGAVAGGLMAIYSTSQAEPVEDALIPASNDPRPVVKTSKGTFVGRPDDSVALGTRLTELGAPAPTRTATQVRAAEAIIEPSFKISLNIAGREIETVINDVVRLDESSTLGNSITKLITRGDMG